MVRTTSIQCGLWRRFGVYDGKKKINHRVPLKYQRFQEKLDPDEIIAHYSRDDIDQINPRAGERTYKDAQETIGRKNYLLPNLSAQDLEINELFQKELDRQRAIVARVNKIKVVVESNPGRGTQLMMNQDISTPFDCARHIHDLLTTRSVVAELGSLETNIVEANASAPVDAEEKLVDEALGIEDAKTSSELVQVPKPLPRTVLWDMHRPLQDSCTIKFRHFAEKDVHEVNRIYWRSCSFVMGMAIRMAFKDGIRVLLHSWPKPDIKSGSFLYDTAVNLSDTWRPCESELRAFTKIMWRIRAHELPFDRLQVDRDMAQKLFASNPFKLSQIDSILKNESSGGKVTVYRCGGLLDISVGPMISNTSQIGRITLAAVHPFELEADGQKGVYYRFQGVSLPQQLPVSSYLYQNLLIEHARKLNKAAL